LFKIHQKRYYQDILVMSTIFYLKTNMD